MPIQRSNWHIKESKLTNLPTRQIIHLCRQPNFMCPYRGLLGAFAMIVKLESSLSSSISHRTAVAGPGYRLLLWQVCSVPLVTGTRCPYTTSHQTPVCRAVCSHQHIQHSSLHCVCPSNTFNTHPTDTLSSNTNQHSEDTR